MVQSPGDPKECAASWLPGLVPPWWIPDSGSLGPGKHCCCENQPSGATAWLASEDGRSLRAAFLSVCACVRVCVCVCVCVRTRAFTVSPRCQLCFQLFFSRCDSDRLSRSCRDQTGPRSNSCRSRSQTPASSRRTSSSDDTKDLRENSPAAAH